MTHPASSYLFALAAGIGAERAATTLAKPGGYLRSAVKIGLPEPLQPAAKALRAVGLGKFVDALENDMNVSAEIAAANAAPVTTTAIVLCLRSTTRCRSARSPASTSKPG